MTERQSAETAGLRDRFALLRFARESYRSGAVDVAWHQCRQVADLSRLANDPETLADAATVIRASHNLPLNDAVHVLCVEALSRLGESDPVRTARLQAQLVATMNHVMVAADVAEVDDHEATFLRLQAQHAKLAKASHLGDQLLLATQAIALGREANVQEYECWGRRWRLGVYAALGDRLSWFDEKLAITPLIASLDQPIWDSFLRHLRASQSLLEGRFDEAAALSSEAVTVGGPGSEAPFLHVVYRFDLARMTGIGLADVEEAVRGAVDDMAFLARGWLCRVLMAQNRREEAALLWQLLRQHLDGVPDHLPEWHIAVSGLADLCVWFADKASAPQLYNGLAPYAGLQAMLAHTPHEGPVSLQLGRLADLMGDRSEALSHLQTALRSSEQMHAQPYVAYCLAALANHHGYHTAEGNNAAVRGLQMARRLRMAPLETEITGKLHAESQVQPRLTKRELEIASLVAEGHSNATIADALTLSERTVESHVSHILQKLGQSSRVAVALWHKRTGQ